MGREIRIREPTSAPARPSGPLASTSAHASEISSSSVSSGEENMDIDEPTSANARRARLSMQEQQAAALVPPVVLRLRSAAPNAQTDAIEHIAGIRPLSPSVGAVPPLTPLDDVQPLPPLLLPSSDSEDEPRVRMPTARRTQARGAGEPSLIAGIPAEAATTRARRIGLSQDEAAARADRLRRVRARLQQARERATALENAGTPDVLPYTLPQASSPPARNISLATDVAIDLETLAADLRNSSQGNAAEALDSVISRAGVVLRRLEYIQEHRTPASFWRGPGQDTPAPRASPPPPSDEAVEQSIAARLQAARARVQAQRARIEADNPPRRPTIEEMQDLSESEISTRIANARARVAVNRARLSEAMNETSSVVLDAGPRRVPRRARTRPFPSNTSASAANVVTGRNQEMLQDQPWHRDLTGELPEPVVSAAEIRHRQRGYHREDGNGDPIDSENELSGDEEPNLNALQRAWRRNERMRRTAPRDSPMAEDKPAVVPVFLGMGMCVGR